MRRFVGAGISKLSTVILAVTLVFSGIVIYLGSAGSASEESTTALVYLPDPQAVAEIRGSLSHILEEYDSFVLAEVTPTEVLALERLGAFVQDYDAGRIGIDGYEFNTRGGEPDLPAHLRVPSAYESEWGYYIVQFRGPVKQEWTLSMERLGARVLDYVPTDAFIMDFRGPAPAALDDDPAVQWYGLYQPAYKIQPRLRDASGLVEVKIITFKGEGLGSVLATLGKAGMHSVDYDDILNPGIVRFTLTEDFGVVKARVPAELVTTLANLRAVQYIEPWEEMRIYNYETQAVMQTNLSGNTIPIDSPSARRIWNMGLTGAGQLIGIADTGLDYDHNQFRNSSAEIGQIDNVTRMYNRKVVRYLPMSWSQGVDPSQDVQATRDSANNAKDPLMCTFGDNCTVGHGTLVSSTAAGNDQGTGTSNNDGVAKDAKIFLQDIGTVCRNPRIGNRWDDCLRYIPDDYDVLFIWPYNDGVRIHSNSWGARNTDYDLEAMMVDKFVWEHQDMLILFSNGNGGPGAPQSEQHDVGSPATAKSAVSVGGTRPYPNQNDVSSSSSRGPTYDGRRKPTVMAPFNGDSAESDGDPTTSQNLAAEYFWGGTSYSSPAMAGSAALIRQYFVDGYYPTGIPMANNELYPSAALLKAMLAASAEQMTGFSSDSKNEFKWPNWSQGWGRPVLDNALYFPGDTRKLSVVDHTEGLLTGQSVTYTFSVASGAGGFKAALAWSDYPASVGTDSALVNNLDLQVTSPTGQVYRGNFFGSFQQGRSLPGGGFDTIHPLETVYLPDWATAPGQWTITIYGTDVPAGPQPFGLVVVSDLDMGWGQLSLDREVYSESDTINIRVQDTNAVSVQVSIVSDTETVPEIVPLIETPGGSGIWKGSIVTAFGTTTSGDGILQVHDLDTVTATYTDSSPPHDSTADAVIDAAGPVITNALVIDITNAAATVTWDTDEPSDSVVYYGESPLLELGSVSMQALQVNHAVDLTNLKTGTRYFFDVESTDWFGHTTRDTNGGVHYSFTTTEKGEILLVIGDSTILPNRIGHYEDAFRAYDWSYNLWYVERSGEPPLSTLQQYKVVEWQVGLEQYPPFEPSARQLVTDYLDYGGRLFVSSHDVAWAFDLAASPDNDEFSNADTHEWLRSTMKADWEADPSVLTHIEGITGNFISGSYDGSARISYQAHRDGGSGDEILQVSAGGNTFPTWDDFGGDATPARVGHQWTSSGSNGTSGIGVWGGKPSKLVVNFFEFTGLNFATDNDPTRNEVMDKTIRWLLGTPPQQSRDHPDLAVSYPNGGEVFAGNTASIYWNVTTFGTNVASQAVYFSPDSGQSWFFVTTLGAAPRTYAWDISGEPNGCGYRVRVVAEDDGDPPLSGADDSDGNFCITRPGGDNDGPVIVPGSVKVSPNPVTQGQPVTFTAIADDTLKGASNIYDDPQPAEFFIDGTGASGTGTAMSLSVPPTSPTEAVEYTYAAAPWGGGTHTINVHAQDEWGNWGPFQSLQFEVLGVGPVPPQPPSNVRASLAGAGFADVLIEWDLSPSEPSVDNYEIYYGTTYDASTASYGLLTSVGGGVSSYTHLGAGDGDANNYFYCVAAVNVQGSSSCVGQAAKYTRFLNAGPQLVSFPIQPSSTAVDEVFKTAEYAWVRGFDACGSNDWSAYNVDKKTNTLTTVSRAMGYWVDIVTAGYWTVAGRVPASTGVAICDGWNLIGYASMTDETVGNVLASILWIRAEQYDAAQGPYFLTGMNPTDPMTNGYGYWVLVAGDQGTVTVNF